MTTDLASRPEPVTVSCPPVCVCCGAADAEPLLEDGHPIRREYRGEAARLVHCPACDHRWFTPLPDESLLARFYRATYRHHCSVDEDYDPTFWYVRDHVDAVLRAAGEHLGRADALRIHDISCGYGGLVHALAGAGHDATGNDIDEGFIATAHSRGNDRVTVATLEEWLATHKRRVDVATAFHCLEHFLDPVAELARLRALLADRGLAVIRVPNGRYHRAVARSYDEYDWVSFPMHLHYFTPSSAAAALRRAGLKPLAIRCTAWEPDLPGLLVAVGLCAEETRHPEAILEALRSNLILRELEIVAARDDSPLTGSPDAWGDGAPAPRAVPVAMPGQLRAAFTVGDDGPFSFGHGTTPPRVDARMTPGTLDGWDVRRGPGEHCLIGPNFVSPTHDVPLLGWTAERSGWVRVRVYLEPVQTQSRGVRATLYRESEALATADAGFAHPGRIDRIVRVEAGKSLTLAFAAIDGPAFCFSRLGVAIDPVDVDA